MRYHTNHSWCSNCNWDNKMFDSEVIVSIEQKLYTYTIDQYKNNIKDVDWDNLIEYKQVFSQTKYDEEIEMFKNFSKKSEEYKNKILDKNGEIKKEIKKSAKKIATKEIPQLKQNVIDWLNKNIENDKNNKKTWAYGNDEYLLDNTKKSFNLFFKKQIDALMFIHEFSIFKEPIFYFDYFNMQSSEINIDKVIEIYNNNSNEKLIKENIILSNKNKDLEFLTMYDYQLLDWEKIEIDSKTGEVYESDDIHLSKDEVKELIDKKIYNIDSNNNLNIV